MPCGGLKRTQSERTITEMTMMTRMLSVSTTHAPTLCRMDYVIPAMTAASSTSAAKR